MVTNLSVIRNKHFGQMGEMGWKLFGWWNRGYGFTAYIKWSFDGLFSVYSGETQVRVKLEEGWRREWLGSDQRRRRVRKQSYSKCHSFDSSRGLSWAEYLCKQERNEYMYSLSLFLDRILGSMYVSIPIDAYDFWIAFLVLIQWMIGFLLWFLSNWARKNLKNLIHTHTHTFMEHNT